jgi:hypothetical protein
LERQGGWAKHGPDAVESPEQRLAAARDWAARGEPEELAELRAPAAQMSERLQSVVAAAERAAEAIRSDAEQQAHRHLIEAQRKADRLTAERARLIAGLTDELIAQASSVRRHSEQMIAALERAASTVDDRVADFAADVGGEARSLPAASTAAPPPAAADDSEGVPAEHPAPDLTERVDDPEPGSRVPAAQPSQSADPSAEVLLRATQMAIAGEERSAIADRIRTEFGIDPDPVLEQILDT